MARIREVVRRVKQNDIPIEEVREALNAELTPAERHMAFLELNKDLNLHSALVQIDRHWWMTYTLQEGWASLARHIVRRTVEGQDHCALVGRAAVSAVAEGVSLAVGAGSMCAGIGANGVVGCVLVGIDVYRWSKNELTTSELALNVGEHVVGCSAAAAGAVVGGLIPVVGPLTAVVFGFLADWFARWLSRKGVQCVCEAQARDQKERALKEAFDYMGLCKGVDNFATAKNRFRSLILEKHPDHNPEPGANESCAKLISYWQTVRGYYESRGEHDRDGEAFVQLMVMKVRRALDEGWRVARVWFGRAGNAVVTQGDLDDQLEKVEIVTVYM